MTIKNKCREYNLFLDYVSIIMIFEYSFACNPLPLGFPLVESSIREGGERRAEAELAFEFIWGPTTVEHRGGRRGRGGEDDRRCNEAMRLMP
jgi:hypothetical protein